MTIAYRVLSDYVSSSARLYSKIYVLLLTITLDSYIVHGCKCTLYYIYNCSHFTIIYIPVTMMGTIYIEL